MLLLFLLTISLSYDSLPLSVMMAETFAPLPLSSVPALRLFEYRAGEACKKVPAGRQEPFYNLISIYFLRKVFFLRRLFTSESGMGIYFHENVLFLRRLFTSEIENGHLLSRRCPFPSPPSRMFTLWWASTFMKMSLSFAALPNICFIAGIYFCKDVFFLRHICHDHSDNAKIDTGPESPKESSTLMPTLTPYFRSFSSSTSYIPRGVHRSVGMTGSPINDNVINGSIPLSTPILYALLVILLIFLLT